MIILRYEKGLNPKYQTVYSAGADLMAAENTVIKAGQKAKVRTGVWIEKTEEDKIPSGCIPELQIRARSGLAYKHGITLTNAVGTVDADYRDEICVLLWNTGESDFTINRGDRIAQLILNLVQRLDQLEVGGQRVGGFGSTNIIKEESATIN
ncbi:MAG: dUTP diphosphatase [Bdellovibrionota bacterium]